MRPEFEAWAQERGYNLMKYEWEAPIAVAYSFSSTIHAWRVWQDAWKAATAAHDRRVTELLEANNREVERRRAAERRVKELEALLLGTPLSALLHR